MIAKYDVAVAGCFPGDETIAIGRKHPNVKAYLCKIVMNCCLNLLQSSAKQREVYEGTWLPEALVYLEEEPHMIQTIFRENIKVLR